ncbi:MAG TPA: hypothetical protein VGI72_00750 [Gaiellales bacterium]|jgi:hypothetical protein
MPADTPRLRTLGRITALLAITALVYGIRIAAGTTTIGPTTVTAHFQSDAKMVIALVALGIAAASQLGTRTRSPRMVLIAAVAVAGFGLAALAEVWLCIGHWHAQATRAAIESGYGSAGAQNRYGHGVEVVVAGGLLAIAAALVIATRARTRPQRLGLQDQFPT